MYHKVSGTDSPPPPLPLPTASTMSRDVEAQLAIDDESSRGFIRRLRCRSCAEICSTDGCFEISFALWFITFLVLTGTWWIPFVDYQNAKDATDHGCDRKVTAMVIRQQSSTVYSMCDLTLSWKDDDSPLQLPRESVIRWECDPYHPTEESERRDVLFSQSTCHRNGERDLRVMYVSDYEIFDDERHEFVKGPRTYHMRPSPRKLRTLKWTWILVMSAWIVSALPIAAIFAMLVCLCLTVLIKNVVLID